MKTPLLSDIHGNWPALQAVLAAGPEVAGGGADRCPVGFLLRREEFWELSHWVGGSLGRVRGIARLVPAAPVLLPGGG